MPTGVNGSWAANVVTISGTPTASGNFSYTITLTGGCGIVTESGSISVTPDNTIALSSAGGTDAQTVCINSPITNITYNTSGATGATFSGLPTGVNGSWAANVVTISGTPTASGNFSYTITLTGGCGNVTESGSISVTPDNTIALSSAGGTDAQTVCINSPITNITYTTSGATGATFSGLPTGVNGSWAANVVTISGTPTASGNFSYAVTLTGGCGNIIANGSIAVNSLPNVTFAPLSDVCIDEAAFTLIEGSPAGGTYSGPGVSTGQFDPATAGVGTHTVTYTYNDGNGCVNSASTDITVNPLPVITLTSKTDVLCATDGDGAINITVSNGTPNYSYSWTTADGSGLSASAEDQTGLSAGTYTVVVTDANGCSATSDITIDILDNEDPVITFCPGEITQATDPGECRAYVTFTEYATATDNCPGVTITNSENGGGADASDYYDRGTTTVTFTATDTNGNTATCDVLVTIYDNEGPVVDDCPPTVLYFNNSPGTCEAVANWTEPVETEIDNCTHKNKIDWYEPSQNPGDVFEVGSTTIEYRAVDEFGNETVCSTEIIVVDSEDPVITGCPDNITINSDAGSCFATVSWTEPTASDNCTTSGNIIWTKSSDPGDSFPIGTTTVDYTASDEAGNIATCSFTVTVTDDEAPVISNCPTTINKNNDTGSCNAIVSWTEPTASDNCTASGDLIWTKSHTPGSTFDIGTTTVTYSVMDNYGNVSAVCSFDVVVTDTEDPELTCPGDMTVSATAGRCDANVSVPLATFYDNCPGGAITNSYNNGGPNASDVYPVGTTEVIYTVTDAAGTEISCSTFITVADDEAPTINCPSNITVNADNGSCDANVSLIVNYSDNCSGASITNNFNSGGADASDNYPVGTTTVEFIATDAAGNTTPCSVDITVIDNQDPVISCPAAVSQAVDPGSCEATVSNLIATFTDNCTGGSITNDYNAGGADASDSYPIGTTTVKFTATDAAGNTDECTVTVTITDDLDPVITCPGDASKTADPGECEAYVSISLATLSDNCAGGSIVNDHNSGGANASGIYPVGTTTVEFTGTDAAGNSVTCTMDVTVTDDEAPTPDLPNLFDVIGDACETTIVNAPSATDNCDGPVFGTTSDPTSYSSVGTYSILWTYEDGIGNTSTQTQTVIITSVGVPSPTIDNLPTVRGECSATVTGVPTAETNCSTTIDGTTSDPLTYNAQGSYVVTWAYDDGNGNITTQTQAVIVEDTQPPVLSCINDTTVTADPVSCTASIALPLVTATDGCSTPTITNDYNSGGADASDTYPVGTTTVTFTATDDVGMTSICSIDITIEDNEDPVITCPSPITQTADPGKCEATITGFISSATDNCSTVTITNDFNSGGANASGTYPVGTTTVKFIATDQSGNQDSCTVDVTITDDEAPVVNCPGNITKPNDAGSCDAFVTISNPTFTENCSNVTITNDYNGGTDASDTYPVGTTPVTFTATDEAGNISTSCTINVIVTDNEVPVKPTLASVTEQCSVTLTAPTTTDNCSGTITGTTPTAFPYTTTGTSVITWTFIDAAGNYTTANQTVTINDNTSPVWDTFPATANIECSDDSSPLATGTPTATDNCGTPTITYSDATTSGNCVGRSTIIRTWTATDASGNFVTQDQTINVTDNTPPVLTCTDYNNFDPNVIPSYLLHTGVSATDNCSPSGLITYELISEEYFGLDQVAGFCPTSLERVYVAYDNCGNASDPCTQTYTFTNSGSCEACIDDPSTTEDDVPFFGVIFDDPDSTWTSPSVIRNGICCYAEGPPPPRCISFNVYLHEDAVGLVFDIPTGAIPGGALYYHIDCGPPSKVGDVICLSGGRFYTITFCEPGNNPNTYSIQSISGATTTEDLVTRADDQCSGNISVSGLDPNAEITWTVSSPNDQSLLNYLDLTDPLNPIFTGDENAPATIVYEVCGTLAGTYVCDGQPIISCADVTVTVLPKINISFDVETDDICEDDIPTINAGITPINLDYSYEWHDGPDGTGAILSTDPYWTPTVPGTYSLVVEEDQTGVDCNYGISNFDITFDYIPPAILAPPTDLQVECNDPDAETIIAQWLATATASDEDISSIPVENDYVPFTHTCNGELKVYFWADDACGNRALDSAYIQILDTSVPVISQQPNDGIAECTSINPDENPDYIAWLANHGGAVINDQCDADLTWTADTASQNWVIDTNNHTKTKTVTFTATDDCDNAVSTQPATFTITDEILPNLTCPTGPVILQAPVGNCDLVVNDPSLEPTYSDGCSVATLEYSVFHADGTTQSGIGSVNGITFQVGISTVTYTVSDDVGNEITCQFDVQITDLIKPVFTSGCPSDIGPINAEAGVCDALVNVPTPTVSDPCDEGYTIINDFNGTDDATDRYPVGITTVKWIIEDASGNKDSCTHTITVIDTQNPTFTSCPNDVEYLITNGGCTLVPSNVPDPTFTDNCPDPILKWEMSGATTGSSPTDGQYYVSGETFNVGVTTVTYVVIDANNLTDTCSFDVWIKNLDAPQFSVTCPDPVVVNADPDQCDADLIIPVPTITNPCNEEYTVSNNWPDAIDSMNVNGIYPVGTTTIEWIITDASGTDWPCTQTITVNDAQDPVITCPANVEDLITNGGCNIVPTGVQQPSISENCNLDVLKWIMTGATVNSSSDTGINYADNETYEVGVTTVTYIAIDEAGNSDTCSHTVWIKNLADPQFSVTCPDPTIVDADPDQCDADLIIPVPTITNPCNEEYTVSNNWPDAIDSMNVNGIYPVGTTTIEWIITDASGTDWPCTQTITVNDAQDPVITCPPNVEDLITNGGCDIVPTGVQQPSISENCNLDVLKWIMTGATVNSSSDTGINYADNETYEVGVTTVTYIAIDEAGNSDTCSHTVWIKNLADPQFSVTCPDPVIVNADPDQCDADLIIPVPTITNPCNEEYTVSNNWPDAIDSMNVNGIYPVGTTTIEWIITDASGTDWPCTQTITVNDAQDPVITCPPNVEDLITNGGCDIVPTGVQQPSISENCNLDVLKWIMTGATVNSSSDTGINYADNETYEVGVTTVTYIAIDEAGNSDTCSHTVWIKNLADPQFSVTCPDPTIVDADPDQCDADLIIPVPTITNPCNEEYTVSNNWPDAIDSMNVNGIYPVGTTTIEWIITDASGTDWPCTQTITVNDLPPYLECPDDIVDQADYEKTYASGVIVPEPIYYDNCPDTTLTWEMTGATIAVGNTDPSGINIVPSPYTFNVGVTTITYTIEDAHGHTATCFFTVTVEAEPVIECPNDTTVYTPSTSCVHNFDPGTPELIEGIPTITWEWKIFDPEGNEQATGTSTGNNPDPSALPMGNHDFELGTSTIQWTAANVSGADTCFHTVTVLDTIPPTFTAPSLTACVDLLSLAQYVSSNLDKTPSPDKYTFKSGNTALDLTDISDNCCAEADMTINWRIDFTDTPDPSNPSGPALTHSPISGSGQLSTYGSDIPLWGDGVNFTTITHYITYWIEDCNGNTSEEIIKPITITPRPQVN
ncbi:HYR domain-containing protein [Sunxiuqinia sp. A32]|uniref:HYR domain-containing protein n=1 Tax=Sunxiuqinia sp. A32 TaxID=3461496 RepID=UPI0040454431